MPAVVRTAIGGGTRSGPHHSYSLHHMFAGFPGLKVVCASTAADAKGLLKSAIRDNDPVLFLEETAAYRTKEEVPLDPDFLIPLGKSKVVSEGDDLTVVTFGTSALKAARALPLLEEAGVQHKYLKYYGEDQYCDGWVDNGDFVPHYRTREENEAIFAACSHVCRGGSWYIRHGQMHWCGRSIRGTELGKVPLRREDYVDILDPETSVEEKRRQLEALMRVRSIIACDYCGGHYGTANTAERRPAGEQLSC